MGNVIVLGILTLGACIYSVHVILKIRKLTLEKEIKYMAKQWREHGKQTYK